MAQAMRSVQRALLKMMETTESECMQPLSDIVSSYLHYEWWREADRTVGVLADLDAPPFRFYHYTAKDPAAWAEQSVKRNSYWTSVRTDLPSLAGDATGIGGPCCKWRIELVINSLEELDTLGVMIGGTRWSHCPIEEFKLRVAIPLPTCAVVKMAAE
jgi:hypothetical protein